MSSGHVHLTSTPKPASEDEPPYYSITLYTWVADESTAADLARRVAEIVESISEIDSLATTISPEEGPVVEPVKVYADLVKGPDER
jgi:hypothetical protein